jgi:hypothetical protein
MAKVCVCVICGKEVLKNTTYFVGNGRACKTHEGVVEKAESMKNQETQRLASITPHSKQKKNEEKSEMLPCTTPSCFICRKPGMHAKTYYAAILVLTNLKELMRQGAKIDKDCVAHDMKKLSTISPIYVLDAKKHPHVRKHLHWKLRSVFDTFGFFGICSDCCRRLDIDPVPGATKLMESKDGLINMMVIGSMVSDDLKTKIKTFITENN